MYEDERKCQKKTHSHTTDITHTTHITHRISHILINMIGIVVEVLATIACGATQKSRKMSINITNNYRV